MPTIAEIRKRYPQYNDLSDEQLVEGLRVNYYSDLPREDFYKRVQFSPEEVADTEDVSIFRDIPGALVKGVGALVGLPAQIKGLVSGFTEKGLSEGERAMLAAQQPISSALFPLLERASAGVSKFGEELKSPGLRERERLAGEAIEAASGQGIGAEVGTALETYLGDPRLLLSGVAEAVPSLVGSFGAGKLARASVRGLARASGRELGETGARRAAVSGAVGFGATQQGADVGAQTYISAMETPDEVWNSNQNFVNRVAAGESPDQVKQDMALSAARQAAGIAGGVSLATAGLMPGVEKMILGPGVAGGLLKRAGKGLLAETAQEGLEEGGGQFAQNVGTQTIDPTQALGEGVAGAATVGALIGGGMGAGVGALNRAPQQVSIPGMTGQGAVPPPPAAPVAPPGEDMLSLLGQEGGTVRLREGEAEVDYVFRGIDDTGRVLLEGADGIVEAADPADIADVLIPTEPPVSPAEPAPPPEAPPATSPPGVSPIAEPVVPVEPETPTPPEAPTATPVEPVLPEPLPEPEPQPEPEPEPIAPPSAPQIRDEQTRDYWRSRLTTEQENLNKRRGALETVLADPSQGDWIFPNGVPENPQGEIETLNQRLAEIEEDYRGLERGEAPIPRARPLDDTTASIVAEPNVPLAEALRDRPAVEVMDWMAQNASTDFHRGVAGRIGNLMRAMEQSGFQFNWGVYDQKFQPRDAGEAGNYKHVLGKSRVRGSAWTHSKGRPGYSMPQGGFDRVDIGVKGPTLPNSGANEVTILHEFAHAATVAAIEQMRRKRIPENSRVGKAVKELQSLKRSAVTHKNKLLKDIANGKQVDPRLAQALQNLEGTNAWDNEKELIVQGLTNIDMQIVLKSMPYKKTNGFVEFIREIGRLIGVTEKDMNGLRRLFELTDELIPTDTAAQQEVVQAMMKPAEYEAAVTPSEAAMDAGPAASVDEFTFDEDVQQAIYSARKVPSLSRRVDRMVRELRAGRITDQEFIAEVSDWSDYIGSVRAGKVWRRTSRPRQRGADYIRQRILEAKRRGDMTEDAADFAEWFIQQNPSLVDDLGISMRRPKVEGRYTGTYDPLRRLMTLMKGAQSDNTAVHEIMHHLERMMPEDVQDAIRTSWKKAFDRASKKAKTQQEKDYFAVLDAFHNGKSIIDGSGQQLPPSAGYDIAMEIGAKLPYDFYQYMNPSEFWAVNATDIMQGRYDVQGSTLGRLKNWLKELGQKIKGLFGLGSNAPILKALDSLSNADGRFQSLGMLQNANVTLADTEPTAPTATAILTPEEDAQRITNEAANAPAADSMEALKEAAQPAIRLYNIRSELQEKNRGCD